MPAAREAAHLGLTLMRGMALHDGAAAAAALTRHDCAQRCLRAHQSMLSSQKQLTRALRLAV